MSRLFLLCLLAPACKGVAPVATDTETDAPASELLGIGVAPRDPIARVGETVEFFATAYYENTTYDDVTDEVSWTVANERVASIDDEGVVTALAEGSTEIVATDASGKGNSVTLTVIGEGSTLDSVSVSPANVSVAVGDQAQLSASARYSDGSTGSLGAACRWESGTEAVATVNPVGRVTGVSAGQATITTTCSGLSATASVTVVEEQQQIADADLVVVNASVSANGLDVFWNVTLRNDGEANASGFYVDSYLEEPATPGSSYADTEWVSDLGPGEQVQITLSLTDVDAGSYQTWIYLDPEDFIVESDEGNNRRGPLQVQPAAPLLGPELTVTYFFAYTDGIETEYLVEIENTGDVAAEDFYVDLFTDETAEPTCPDYGDDYVYVAELAPGEHYVWDPIFGTAPASGSSWTSWLGVDLCGDVGDDASDNTVSYVVEE